MGERVVGLDYGRRRIGVALSDPSGVIASPHGVVEHTGDEPDDLPGELVDLLESVGAERVVVGVPLHMDGRPGEMAEEARAFGRALGERTGLPVDEWDERLSSSAAERALIETGAPARVRREKGRVDAMAAALTLRAYLRSR